MKAVLAMFAGFFVLIGCGTNDVQNKDKSSLKPINIDKVLQKTEKGIRLGHDTDCD